MTEEERKVQQNILRVAMNLSVLLDIGLFPGKHSLGIEECKGFMKSVIDDCNAKLQSMAPPAGPAVMPPAAPIPPAA